MVSRFSFFSFEQTIARIVSLLYPFGTKRSEKIEEEHTMKKVLTILLTLALCLSLFVVAAAEEDDPIVIGQVFWGLHDSYQHAHQVQTQKYCDELGIEYIPIDGQMKPEVQAAGMEDLIARGVDCFSNLTDNNVVGVLSSILEKTDEAGIPVYGSEVEQVKMGCVASAGIDYIALGRQTGEMAARILKGEATASEMDYETITEYGIYINSDALAAMGITVPQEIADRAIESTAE